MANIPHALLILVGLIALVVVLFLWAKRPMYEVMLVGLIALVAVSNQWAHLLEYLIFPAQSSLFFTIFAFLFAAVVFERTRAIQDIVRILLAVVGRARGGAGYVATMASAFMASLSGTGPGNVAATGAFTIPLMKRSGYSPHLAATTEMSASMLGNVIPPAGIILLSFGVYDSLQPGAISLGKYFLAAYAIGVYFLLQRILMLFVLCRTEKVEPVPAEEIPPLGESLRKGWPAALLPGVIFLPLLFDAIAHDFVEGRLGESGGEAFSSSLLVFTPVIAMAYAIWIGRRDFAEERAEGASIFSLHGRRLFQVGRESMSKVAPVGLTIYFAYALSQAFVGLEADEDIQRWFVDLGLPLWALIIVLPIFFAILGMVLPGTAQVAILGSAMVGVFATLGGNPLLLAVLLPAMTGALEGMTPPLALGLYLAMGIADSKFGATVKLALVWIAGHLVVTGVLLAGLLPIPGI